MHSRVAATNARLGKYTVPKGSVVTVSPYCIHHDPTVWDNPEEFRMQRYVVGTALP